jgi:hypothetical protein
MMQQPERHPDAQAVAARGHVRGHLATGAARIIATCLLFCACGAAVPHLARATGQPAAPATAAVPAPRGAGATSLESAAAKAGETGRNVAMSLIGLALAMAAIVLAFRRDFREAAAVLAVGIVCILLATPAGESMLRDTVNALVGS